VKDEYRFQLAFYALILERSKACGRSTVISLMLKCERLTCALMKPLDDFHLTLREIEKIIGRRKTGAIPRFGLQESPWFALCKRDAEACDDICLIYKIRRSDHAKLYDAGG